MKKLLINKKLVKETKIYIGNNSNDYLKNFISSKKLLIISSKSGRLRFLKKYPYLNINNLEFIDKVNNYPTVNFAERIFRSLKKKDYNTIIAFGGGSVIDFSKIIKIFLEINKKISIKNLIQNLKNYRIKKRINLIAIPTTAGTGSEVTNFATLWDNIGKKKLSLESKNLFPNIAILDPKNTLELNYKNTLYTSIDALNQLFDSYWNKKSNKQIKKISSKGIEISLKEIKTIDKKKLSTNKRLKLLYVSLLSGICIKHTRTSICHSISYPLTSYFKVPHGLAVFFTTKEVFNFILERKKKFFDQIIKNTNYKNEKEIEKDIQYILNKHLIKKKIKKYIIKFSKIEKVINQMFSKARFKNFVLNLNVESLREILIKSYY